MIYKFKSKASADLIMLAAPGDQVLRIIGKEPAERGIVEAAALPAAIAALEQAIEADEARRRERDSDAAESDAGTGAAAAGTPRGVTLRQRAWPMIEMMRRALAAKADIVWGT